MDHLKIIYWSLFAAAILPYLILPLAKAGRTYDNADPRNDACYDTPLKQRAMGAHKNSLEALATFAPAVLLALWLKVDPGYLSKLTLLWVVSRVAYDACYLAGQATLRSLVWLVGFGTTVAIFWAAVG